MADGRGVALGARVLVGASGVRVALGMVVAVGPPGVRVGGGKLLDLGVRVDSENLVSADRNCFRGGMCIVAGPHLAVEENTIDMFAGEAGNGKDEYGNANEQMCANPPTKTVHGCLLRKNRRNCTRQRKR